MGAVNLGRSLFNVVKQGVDAARIKKSLDGEGLLTEVIKQ